MEAPLGKKQKRIIKAMAEFVGDQKNWLDNTLYFYRGEGITDEEVLNILDTLKRLAE